MLLVLVVEELFREVPMYGTGYSYVRNYFCHQASNNIQIDKLKAILMTTPTTKFRTSCTTGGGGSGLREII